MDSHRIEAYIGKHLLIGVTYLEYDETLIEQKQFHGRIVRINEHEGIVTTLHGSTEEFKLPFDLDSLQPASTGQYRLRSTGEIVDDPDFLTTWILRRPASTDSERGA